MKCEETTGKLLNLGSLAADYATSSSDEELDGNNIEPTCSTIYCWILTEYHLRIWHEPFTDLSLFLLQSKIIKTEKVYPRNTYADTLNNV